MRPDRVVVDAPRLDQRTGFGKAGEHVLVQVLVARAAIETLDQPVLHRLAGLDVVPGHAAFLRPAQHRVARQLGAVVALTIAAGQPRSTTKLSSSRTTRIPGIDVSTIAARHSRLKS